MRKGVIEVAPGRFRESFGRAFEDFTVGHVHEHRPGRTITDADSIWFTLLTMNTFERPDFAEGATAFLERRPPRFSGGPPD